MANARLQAENRALRLAMERTIGALQSSLCSCDDPTPTMQSAVCALRQATALDFADAGQWEAYRVPGGC